MGGPQAAIPVPKLSLDKLAIGDPTKAHSHRRIQSMMVDQTGSTVSGPPQVNLGLSINDQASVFSQRSRSKHVRKSSRAGRDEGDGATSAYMSEYFTNQKHSQYKFFMIKFDSFLKFFQRIFVIIENESQYFKKMSFDD